MFDVHVSEDGALFTHVGTFAQEANRHDTETVHMFDDVTARYVRFYPQTKYGQSACMRVEVYTTNCPPSAPPPPRKADCFPSDALVTKADGREVSVDQLHEHDEIVATTVDGDVTTDVVTFLSIQKPDEFSPFVVLQTDSNTTLRLTFDHHLPVGTSCCRTVKKTRDVDVGDVIHVVEDGAVVAARITKKSLTHAKGFIRQCS